MKNRRNLRRILFPVSLVLILWSVLLLGQSARAAEELTETTMMEAMRKVSIYEKAGGKGKVTGELQQGEYVFAVKLEGDWYRIVYSGEPGYVEADALRVYIVGEEDASFEQPKSFTEEELKKMIDPEVDYPKIKAQREAAAKAEQEKEEKEKAAEKTKEQAEQAAKEKESKVNLIAIFVMLAVVLGGGGYGFFQWKKMQSGKQEETKETDADSEEEQELTFLDEDEER